MAVDWRLALAQPDVFAIGQQGFERGKQQGMERTRMGALSALAGDPGDEQALAALASVSPQEAMQYRQMAAQQQDREREEQRRVARGNALAGVIGKMPNLPPGFADYALIDPEGAPQLLQFMSQADAQQRAAAKAKAEEIASAVVAVESLPQEQRLAAAQQAAAAMGMDPASVTPDMVTPTGLQALKARALGLAGLLQEQDRAFSRNIKVADLDLRRQQAADASARGWANVQTARINAAGGGGAGGLGKPPSGFRWTKDGNLEAIPGGPGTTGGRLTETQAKAGGFLRLAINAEKMLSRLGGDKAVPAEAARAVYGLPVLDRLVSGSDRQILAAQEAFAEASLRFLTGAAVTKDEARRNILQFYPAPGDTPEVIQQKAGYRQELIEAMRVAAGPAAPAASQQKTRLKYNPSTGRVE